MTKRALMLDGGTMKGAFLVGALKTIHRLLPPNYFDTIFAASVGVFEQAFFASGQIHLMENTWREYVHGNQLINFTNPFNHKPILDLDYLVQLFQSDKSRLDIGALKNSSPKLFTFVTDYKTRRLKLMNLKNGPVFDIMRATSALPVLYSKKVFIEDRRYIDGRMAPVSVFQKFLKGLFKDYDEVIIITPRTKRNDRFTGMKYVLKPSHMPMRTAFDTNRNRIIQTIEQGELDAERFIHERGLC